MKQYIGATHDISEDNFKLLYDKDLKSLVLQIEKGDTIDALWEQMSKYVFGENYNITKEDFINLVENVLGKDNFKENEKIDIMKLFNKYIEKYNEKFRRDSSIFSNPLDENNSNFLMLNEFVTSLAIYAFSNINNSQTGIIHGQVNSISIMQMEALKAGITGFNGIDSFLNGNYILPANIAELVKDNPNLIKSYISTCLCEGFSGKYEDYFKNLDKKNLDSLIESISLVSALIPFLREANPGLSAGMLIVNMLLNLYGIKASADSGDNWMAIYNSLNIGPQWYIDYCSIFTKVNPGFNIWSAFNAIFNCIYSDTKGFTEGILEENPILALLNPEKFASFINKLNSADPEKADEWLKQIVNPVYMQILFYSNLDYFMNIMSMTYNIDSAYFNQICESLGIDSTSLIIIMQNQNNQQGY